MHHGGKFNVAWVRRLPFDKIKKGCLVALPSLVWNVVKAFLFMSRIAFLVAQSLARTFLSKAFHIFCFFCLALRRK